MLHYLEPICVLVLKALPKVLEQSRLHHAFVSLSVVSFLEEANEGIVVVV